MLQQGQVQNPVLQGSVQLYAPYSSHYSWSCPPIAHCLATSAKRRGGILQIRAYLSAQPCSARCTLSSLCTELCKSCIKKNQNPKNNPPLATISFLPAFHSPPILPPGKLVWIAIFPLWYCLDYLWALRTQERVSLISVTSSATDK